MERGFIVILALHLAVAVLAIVGCVISSQNYGLNYPEYITRTPIKPTPGVRRDEHNRSDDNVKNEYVDLLDDQADYNLDARSYIMIPFIGSAVATAGIIITAFLDSTILQSTAIPYADFTMWILNFSFMTSFLNLHNSSFTKVELFSFWQSCTGAIVVLHVFILILLSLSIGACGRYLRRRPVYWPSCNCLQFFTLNTLLCIIRWYFAFGSFFVAKNDMGQGYKPINPYDDNYCMEKRRCNNIDFYCFSYHVCGNIRLPAATYYISTGMTSVSLIVASEALLSHWWGSAHHKMSVAWSCTSGLVNIILGSVVSPVGLAYMNAKLGTGYNFPFTVVGIEFFYAWLLCYCPEFINSPPNILKVLCGKKSKTEHEKHDADLRGSETVNNEAVDAGELPSQDNDSASTSGIQNTSQTDQEKSSRMKKARCLIVNGTLVVLGLLTLGFLGYAVSYNLTSLWSETVLLVTLTSTVARAGVALLTLTATTSPSANSGLQVLVEVLLEGVLILFGVAAVLSNSQYLAVIVASVFAIIIFVIKIVETTTSGAIDMALKLLMNSCVTGGADSDNSVPVAAAGTRSTTTDNVDITGQDAGTAA